MPSPLTGLRVVSVLGVFALGVIVAWSAPRAGEHDGLAEGPRDDAEGARHEAQPAQPASVEGSSDGAPDAERVDAEGSGEHAAAPFVALRTLVIDPGHGGDDGGGLGVIGIPEKWFALRTALALAERLEQEDPTLEVVLTREIDVYPTLEERTHLATLVDADAFLSIHYNMATNPEAVGIETFHLAPEGTTPGEPVPGHEERGPSRVQAEVGVEGDVLRVILDDLARTGATHRSRRLAMSIQDALIDATGAPSRGVRSAQFRVLRGQHAPAIVCELGFLSHAEEGKRVLQAAYHAQLVEGLVAGLRAYDAWAAASGLESETYSR